MSNNSREIGTVSISIKKFWLYMIFYTFLSWFSFILVTEGWSIFFPIIVGGIFCGCFIFITTILSIKNSNKKMRIDTHLFCLVFILQIMAMLSNINDCGDNAGSFNLIQKIIDNRICSHAPIPILFTTSIIFLIGYLVTFLYFWLKPFVRQ